MDTRQMRKHQTHFKILCKPSNQRSRPSPPKSRYRGKFENRGSLTLSEIYATIDADEMSTQDKWIVHIRG